jgi:hypothetical protein
MPNDKGVLCRWESYGVVSLLDMLEFAANKYVELSHDLGALRATLRKREPDVDVLSNALNRILSDANTLGLRVTRDQIGTMMREFVEYDPTGASLEDGQLRIKGTALNVDRLCHHIESVYSVLKSELGSISIKAVPRDKDAYIDVKWLTTSIMFQKYPDTVDEFQAAGRCFAYGENTACVFHLMRIVDFYLRKVAESLRITYDARNWHGIGEAINRKMEAKYQTKTDEWKHSEPFYAGILVDIQAIGRGHRNPVLHELEKKYDEREALYMLTVVESFGCHVAGNL